MSREEKWQNYKDTVSGRNLKKATTPNVRKYRKLKDKRDDTLDLVHPGYYKAQAQYDRYKRGLEGAEQEDYFMFDPRASKLYALEAKKNRLSVAHHPKYYKYDNQMHEMMKDPQAKQEVSDYKNARKKRNMARLGTGALVLGAGLGGVLAADGAYRLGKKLISKRAEELKEEMEKEAGIKNYINVISGREYNEANNNPKLKEFKRELAKEPRFNPTNKKVITVDDINDFNQKHDAWYDSVQSKFENDTELARATKKHDETLKRRNKYRRNTALGLGAAGLGAAGLVVNKKAPHVKWNLLRKMTGKSLDNKPR